MQILQIVWIGLATARKSSNVGNYVLVSPLPTQSRTGLGIKDAGKLDPCGCQSQWNLFARTSSGKYLVNPCYKHRKFTNNAEATWLRLNSEDQPLRKLHKVTCGLGAYWGFLCRETAEKALVSLCHQDVTVWQRLQRKAVFLHKKFIYASLTLWNQPPRP